MSVMFMAEVLAEGGSDALTFFFVFFTLAVSFSAGLVGVS
jgi:hypothetical protein